ncbi:MAG: outer membrane protein assembly factor BamD [Bacteroidales bacterium]|nr:outer membrane protein assembly factor BamD [Bacteroidales bacterium]MDD2570686.1 outer membrane protein assembly factor BamD [Bacteroidales bacterium]MDD2813309.1 outer membrane protein assembly factor BamD [Bacteroidales bacterium]MDD3384921.1 outer membrane protein assembly factor BamD [Bacteroidales bacterium]MDD3812176.1 outer membrane protein assembly factor BamD [Bacteroidales bacterium]
MFKKLIPGYLSVGLLILLMSSCGDYSKILKSSDYDLKYEKALEYFAQEDYTKASTLLEELLTIVRGTERAEQVAYHHAYCAYYQQDYIMAGYYFGNFVKSFPTSPLTEECAFMVAKCYYEDSPGSSLDQANTHLAIEEFQRFMNRYPASERVDECNRLIDELQDKLVKKSFESASLYYKLGEYKAAITALQNSLKEYPGTRYREELLYLIVKSSYELARNSVLEKIKERFTATIEACQVFKEAFPESSYVKEVERIQQNAQKFL